MSSGHRKEFFMKITPLEIRQKTFEKVFRGYDKDEVTSFLSLLSQEWEKANEEKRMLQMKLEHSEKESAKLREVEGSLFRTLKAAEDTGASMIEQANKTAELILKEARMDADALLTDAKNQAKVVRNAAENRAKEIREDLREDVTALVESYETLLAQREIILKNMRNMATETLENVNFAKDELKKIDVSVHAKAVKEMSRNPTYPVDSERDSFEVKQTIVTEAEYSSDEKDLPVEDEVIELDKDEVELEALENEPLGQEPEGETGKKEEEKPGKRESGSFFDQFD